MPVNYGVLRGKVINSIPYKSGTDHYQIEIQADKLYAIAVDVYSELAGAKLNPGSYRDVIDGRTTLDTDRLVMYYKDENFTHPLTAEFLKVAEGFTAKANLDPAICLDYIRTSPALFPLSAMQVVTPKVATAPPQILNGDIGPWVQKATNNPNAVVFAFGSGWDDNTTNSSLIFDWQQSFSPNPSLGIHDIHMNQGDSGSEEKNNGTYQDGALFFYFSDTSLWIAMFFRFQNQSIQTDDNGNPA